jgi:alpha-beta hydrolase superfamily lysophospholipase
VDMVTRTQSVRSWIAADPDRRFQPTGSMLLGVLKLSIDLKKINSVPCPLFMFSAEIDHIVDVKLGEKTFRRLRAPSKKQRHFREAWHDLMFDPVLDEVADDIAGWISSTANLQPEKQR